MIEITVNSKKGQKLSISGSKHDIAHDVIEIAQSLSEGHPGTVPLLKTILGVVDDRENGEEGMTIVENMDKRLNLFLEAVKDE